MVMGQISSPAQTSPTAPSDPLNNMTTTPGNKAGEVKEDVSSEEGAEEMEVVVGIDKFIKLDFVPYTDVHIGNRAILDYKISPQRREVVLNGQKPGKTSVIIRDTTGDVRKKITVNISSTDQSKIVSELRDFLGDIEGLEIGIKGGKVYIGGEIVVPNSVGIINTVLSKYPDVIQIYELSPHTQGIIGQKMQAEIQRAGLKDVSVRIVNKVYWLEGVVSSEGDKELATKLAEGYLPEIQIKELSKQSDRASAISARPVIQNFITINPAKQKPEPPPKLVKIIAQFVELKKDYNRIFGFKWTPTLSTGGGSIQFGKTVSDGVTTKSNGTFSGTIANLFPQLAAAKSAGYAREIQQGMVIVKDRTRAKIQKRSTVPFVLGTGEFQRAANVETGFVLEVRPGILGEDKIDLGIGLSVTMSHASNGNTTNQVETNLVVKSRDSAVVGGISINENQTQYDKDPPFGQDKVDPETGSPLFSFLRSKSYSINKSQFVVFITPEIIESASKATGEVKSKFRQRRR
jgi:pilus assembly protein CpaC